MQGREEGRDPASAARAHVKRELGAEIPPVSIICADPHKEIEVVKNLYTSLLEAKESVVSRRKVFRFRIYRLVAQKADGLKEKSGCERVKFSVSVEDGHVTFKQSRSLNKKLKKKATAGGRLSLCELTGPVTGSSQWLC